MFPIGHGMFPIGHGMFPIGHGIFPIGHGMFPIGHGMLLFTRSIAMLQKVTLRFKHSKLISLNFLFSK